jgi:6-phosphofructokinase 1
VARELDQIVQMETRATVLGHLQRGGVPTAFDRILATRFGVEVVRVAASGKSGLMVSLRGREIVTVTLDEAVASLRRVQPDGEIVRAARSVGTSFGD